MALVAREGLRVCLHFHERNLFNGIIVSTMQELDTADAKAILPSSPAAATVARIEADLAELKKVLAQREE